MRRLHGSLRPWALQRLTAVVVGVLALALLWALLADPPRSAAQWRAQLADPLISTAIVVLALAVAGHAWVGLRDVVIDYGRPAATRAVLMSVIGIALVAMVAAVFLALATARSGALA